MDTLTVPIKSIAKEVATKRTALKAMASTFDPLGLLTPLFFKLKMFIQDLWINKYDWDDSFDEATTTRYQAIIKDVKGFRKDIPRYINTTKNARYDLVLFYDASQRAYAAVAYLVCRPNRGQSFSSVIFSKSKLATAGKATIPRLELMAAVLAAKLVRFIRKQLNIEFESVNILSDSQIALYWIHSSKQLKTFVNNRVKYIKQVMDELSEAKIINQLHYVNTEENIADCAMRGLSASELIHHRWWLVARSTLYPQST
ncbi:hypothetical protein GCK32_005613 [Trichostrongylus colubriformis]|uniref:Uncharacterized protein n=1 Tax=Trichostrongylus colubriformis TaxID=6319 RepID=A0AAN8FSS6_TRICO